MKAEMLMGALTVTEFHREPTWNQPKGAVRGRIVSYLTVEVRAVWSSFWEAFHEIEFCNLKPGT